jgi:hypothetical protein
VPRALSRVCLKALAPKPSDRHPGAEALADELRRWLDPPRRRRLPIAALAAGLLAGLALGMAWSRPGRVEGSAPPAPAPTSDGPPPRPRLRALTRAVGRFVGAAGSPFYHRPGCAGAPADGVGPGWATAAEAEASGRRPCRICQAAGG